MLWNKSLETGVPLMDTQHQELFRRMDDLSDTSKADRVPQTLDFLGKYVDKHFRGEEDLHLSSGYPQRADHKKLYDNFVAEYKKLQDEYNNQAGRQGLMTLRINRVALDWLRKHIMGPDMMFAKFYLAKHGRAGAVPDRPALPLGLPAPYPVMPRKEPAPELPVARAPFTEEMLRSVPAQALANELVRRSKGA